jgi:predicted CxxxxCH...CXXCH cytochrome family protein
MSHGRSAFGRFGKSIGWLILAAVAAFGCSKATTTGGLVDANGNHPAGFVTAHPSFAAPDGSACTECHGSDLRGGIVNVSCFSASRNGAACHATGPAFHPANWVDTKARGTSAWHGGAFLGNVRINGLPCSACHTLGTSGTPGTGKCVECHFTYTAAPVRRIPVGNPTVHDWTDFQVAGHTIPAFANDNVVNAVCIACHLTNIRFSNPPQECHNCHGPAPAFHPDGWGDPAQHGEAAKDAPGGNRGFAFCQTCHGTNFGGLGTAPTCINNAACHGLSGNPNTPLANNQAPHARRQWRGSAGTPLTHASTASDNSNATVCYACHRDRLNTLAVPVPVPPFNQASPPGCFNSSLCHSAVLTSPHPLGASWLPGTLHGATAKADLTYCQACHANLPAPATNPRFNVLPNPASANSGCENCHNALSAHPPAAGGQPRWYFHRLSGNKHVACPQCHGATLQGPAEGGVGPRCQDCHRLGPPIVFPATAAQPATCTTCHRFPPNGTPNQFPNIAGKHGIHNVLAGVHDLCGTCHSGAGYGSGANHFVNNVVNVAFLATYNAESGAATYNPANRTCSNVKCHGGQTTPDWQTAAANAIDVPNACLSCHASGTAQFNSFNSGEHSFHIGEFGLSVATCKRCHDATRLNVVGHFDNLASTAFEQPPQNTLNAALQYNGTSCNPSAGGLTGCHGSENW